MALGKKKKKPLRFLPGGMLGMLRSVFIKPQHVLSEHVVADDYFNDGLALLLASHYHLHHCQLQHLLLLLLSTDTRGSQTSDEVYNSGPHTKTDELVGSVLV